MKDLAARFADAVGELISFAGDDEILKKKLRNWVNSNFRQHSQRMEITEAELRTTPDKDMLVQFRTQAMMGNMIRQLSTSGDLEIGAIEQRLLSKKVMFTNAITFNSKNEAEDLDEAPTVG